MVPDRTPLSPPSPSFCPYMDQERAIAPTYSVFPRVARVSPVAWSGNHATTGESWAPSQAGNGSPPETVKREGRESFPAYLGLVPKLYLGTRLREKLSFESSHDLKAGHGPPYRDQTGRGSAASGTSAFPSTTWEGGKAWRGPWAAAYRNLEPSGLLQGGANVCYTPFPACRAGDEGLRFFPSNVALVLCVNCGRQRRSGSTAHDGTHFCNDQARRRGAAAHR